MKVLYFQCNMGAAGDMLMASLLELLDEPENFVDRFNMLRIPKVYMNFEKSKKCGIAGTKMVITVDGIEEKDNILDVHEEIDGKNNSHNNHHKLPDTEKGSLLSAAHHHAGLSDIESLIDSLDIPEKVKTDAKNVYKIIAQAESTVHGAHMTDIHFHEVGTMDAVADIVGVCLLINEISPDSIIASPINVGSGQVKCSHGILPVPAPATAAILKNVPIYQNGIKGELCTPTGAALLKYYVDEFGEMPSMCVGKIGYGMGHKNFDVANCVRSMLGKTNNAGEKIIELCCNIDDMTGEAIGYATEVLLNNGALDVYTTSIAMKKGRPGIMLTCMCREADREKFLPLIFKHTTTLGIREYKCSRYVLQREIVERETEFGMVHIKRAEGYGVRKEKAEYEDIRKIAEEKNMSVEAVLKNMVEISSVK